MNSILKNFGKLVCIILLFLLLFTVDVSGCETITVPSNSFKSYMSYKTITKVDSPQYKLQNLCITDDNGLRKCCNRYIVAVGHGVGGKVGDFIDVNLSNGTTIYAIIGDYKGKSTTDETMLITKNNKCCSEFIVDTALLNSKIKTRGDVGILDNTWNFPVSSIVRYEVNVLDMEENL